ncbi:hypothetical protein, partial [Flavobacterium tyrosinilyticum]|uniref:hypothetical protein n=1 Tax=Flavobacterium tyrosinilyticum TaxID=1658740 RepID=UPI0020308338
VYERVLFSFRLCFKAGAKLKLLFVSCKKNLKFFLRSFQSRFLQFSSQSLNELSVLRGAKVEPLFSFPSILNEFFSNFFLYFS